MKKDMTENNIFLRIRQRMYIAACLLLAVGVAVLCGSCGGDRMTELKKDSKWKVVGTVDVQTDILTEIVPVKGYMDATTGILADGEPFDCEKCYTLTFVTGAEAYGRSVHNELTLSFFEPIQITSTNISFASRPECLMTH